MEMQIVDSFMSSSYAVHNRLELVDPDGYLYGAVDALLETQPNDKVTEADERIYYYDTWIDHHGDIFFYATRTLTANDGSEVEQPTTFQLCSFEDFSALVADINDEQELAARIPEPLAQNLQLIAMRRTGSRN